MLKGEDVLKGWSRTGPGWPWRARCLGSLPPCAQADRAATGRRCRLILGWCSEWRFGYSWSWVGLSVLLSFFSEADAVASGHGKTPCRSWLAHRSWRRAVRYGRLACRSCVRAQLGGLEERPTANSLPKHDIGPGFAAKSPLRLPPRYAGAE